MISKNTIYFAAAAILFAACQQELQNASIHSIEEVDKTVAPLITAKQENGKPTPAKSTLEVELEGSGTIYWTPADEINVFYGTTSTRYVSQNVANSTTAVFSTSDVIGISESSSTNIWGLYPYNPSATCTGSAVNTTLPATQYGVPGTFDDDLFITLAHNSSTVLEFFNVCGGIKFSLSRDDISSITFRGNNNEDIAGDISLEFVDGLPNVSVTSGAKTITVTPKEGSAFESGEYYYIVLRPVTLSGGFTMTFTTTAGDSTPFNYSAGPVTIKRSTFSKKDDMDTFAELPPPSNQIWYTSTDGNIVTPYKENDFSPSIVSNTYADGKGIITFDGPLTTMPKDAFYSCTKLASVALPRGATLSYRCFSGCDALTSVQLPSDLQIIDIRAFGPCRALEHIVLPQSVTNLRYGAFMVSSSLIDIIIPSGVTIMGIAVFSGCTGLTRITVLPTTPPTGGIDMFSNTNDAPIYVPAESVDIYKSAEFWSDYAERIFAIN